MKHGVRSYHFARILLPVLTFFYEPLNGGSMLHAGSPSPIVDLVQYVNPLIGTGPSLAPNPVPGGRGGSVFPGPVLPFGMIQWSPDTPHGEPSGYGYNDDSIAGFSLTHFSGAGCPNNEDLPIIATTDENQTTLRYKHENEKAEAGYYSVKFDNDVQVELTATTRTGFGRFTFPRESPAVVILDSTRNANFSKTSSSATLQGQDTVVGSTLSGNFCYTGTRYTLYFAAKFDRPWISSVNRDGKVVLTFDPKENPEVRMKVAISYVSEANAALNLSKESEGQDFDSVRAAARNIWNQRLNSIQVSGGSENDRVKFYTALYHSLIPPNVFSDVNGEYIGFDKVVHNAGSRVQYANFSGWDIYRSQIQLLAFLFPDVASDILQSFVVDANQCGAFPKWSQNNADANVMVGDPGSLIVANGYAFGARNFDSQRALEIMRTIGSKVGTNCNGALTFSGLDEYLALGYLSSNHGGGASTTLEFNSRDFAVAQFARALGDDDQYRQLRARSSYWQNLIHPGGLLQTRLPNGEYLEPLAGPGGGSDGKYIEGNAEQYTWMIPHDARTLFDRLGGNEAVVKRLDGFFSDLNAGMNDPNFYMGNEPNFATPWMYNWAGAPAHTADVIRRIIDEAFTALPGGLPGNDDLGATSSWYVWAALGMYPQIPGTPGLTLTSPLFPSSRIRLGNGHVLQIDAPSAPARYIQDLKLNGKAQKTAWLELDQLQKDSVLTYELAETASAWGTKAEDAPPSFGPGIFADQFDAANNKGASVDGRVNDADFDGFGYSYSHTALTGESAMRYGIVNYAGINFPWSLAALNNTIASGQTIAVKDGSRGSRLAFLGSASLGPSQGTGRIHYKDGSTQDFRLEFSDWTLGNNTHPLAAGNEVAIQLPYRNQLSGQKDPATTYVFYTAVPLDPAREVASVTLPSIVSVGRLHIFSMVIAP